MNVYFFGGAYGLTVVIGHTRRLRLGALGECVLHAIDGSGPTLRGAAHLGQEFELPPRHAWRACEIFEALIQDVSDHDEATRLLEPHQTLAA